MNSSHLSLAQRTRELREFIASGESNVRWIDFYAASEGVELVAGERGSPIDKCLLFEVILALSVKSAFGEVALPKLSLINAIKQSSLRYQDVPGQEMSEALDDLKSVLAVSKGLIPIVVEEDDWMLTRLNTLQQHVRDWFEGHCMQPKLRTVVSSVKDSLQKLFNLDGGEELDYQAVAAAQSLLSRLLLISGGPGTGKTTTAARIMLLNLLALLHEDPSRMDFQSACIAPTGKAAQRLASSLRIQCETLIDSLDLPENERARLENALPEEGKTIHRFLSEQGAPMDPLSAGPRLDDNEVLFGVRANRRRSPDVLIVDEASMIDLALMERLIFALDDHSIIVFMGDPFQLPPVEAGEVFANWVDRLGRLQLSVEQLDSLSTILSYTPETLATLNDDCRDDDGSSICSSSKLSFNPLASLRKSYRFSGALAECATLLKEGSLQSLDIWMESDSSGDRMINEIPDSYEAMLDNLSVEYSDFFAAIKARANLDTLQGEFDRFQILCSTRLGKLGSVAISAALEQRLAKELPSELTNLSDPQLGMLYSGKPVLVESNHPEMNVFNGDIGFVVIEPSGAVFVEFYRGNDFSALRVPISKLATLSSALAITIHKSQGSEYQNVSVIIAPYSREMVSRRLLYTAVTRSKERLTMYIERETLRGIFLSA